MARLETLTQGIKKMKNWFEWFLQSLKKSETGEVKYYKLRDGQDFFLRDNRSDRGIFQEVILYDCYDTKWDDYKDKCVVDIGSHIGLYSSMAVKKGARKIVCFEPCNDNYEIMRTNLDLAKEKFNPDCEIVTERKVVVGFLNSGEKVKLSIDEDNTGGSTLLSLDDSEEVEVEVVNINDVIDQLLEVDYLKMDCEGAEYDILYNMSEDNWKKIKTLVIEIHRIVDDDGNVDDGDDPDDLIQFILNKGFECDIFNDSFPENVDEKVFYFWREDT